MASGRTLVLITGANQGLGYYAAQQMAATGKFHVLIGSRDISKAHKAIETLAADSSLKVDAKNLEALQIDVTSDESINAAARTVQDKYGHLDILMLNAGIAQAQAVATDGTGPSLRELYQSQFNTNLFGAAIVTEVFLPLLRKSTVEGGKRITFTSSGLASLKWGTQDNLYSAKMFPIYRSTKTALNMLMLHYAKLLEGEGFVVGASDPGYCGTNLNSNSGPKDPREGAKVLIASAVDPKEKVHAVMLSDDGEGRVAPW